MYYTLQKKYDDAKFAENPYKSKAHKEAKHFKKINLWINESMQ
jgi:hypothetical protein